MRDKLMEVLMDIYSYYTAVIRAKNTFGVNPFRAFLLKVKGYTPDHYTLYQLEENNIDDYLSENDRWATRKINKEYRIALDDKLLFYELFHREISIPENLFWMKEGKFLDLKGGEISKEGFRKLLAKHQELFIKPVVGGGGRGIFKVSNHKGNYFIDNQAVTFPELVQVMKESDNFVGTPAIEQDAYASQIFSESTNTIRILTTYHEELNQATIPEAMHRFGTEETKPLDNVSIGGLFAQIDVATGRLSEAKNYANEEYERHPDSQEAIKGVSVPKWEAIKAECIRVAEKFPYIPYMAWDIVVTEEGFEVIEINASTGITLFQMWEGKRNSDLGEFFRSQGVIK